MGVMGNALDLIRTVARRENVFPSPSVYFDDLTRTLTSYGGSAIGPQSDYNKYLAGNVQLDQDLMGRYADYEDMASYPEIGSALDLYADDATTQDVLTGRSIWYESEDKDIEKITNDMLHYNLRAEEDLWEITRSLCGMGNCFEEIVVLDKLGVMKLNNMAAPTVRRIEDKQGVLFGFVQDPTMAFRIDTNAFLERLSQKGVTRPDMQDLQNKAAGINDQVTVYEPWEVVHFRMRGKSRKELYGTSVVDQARWVWKRLSMMEDAMLLYKLTRSPQRFAFYVDVGDVPPNQARSYVNKVKNDFRKTKYIDQSTGKVNWRYNPLGADEDIFIPVRKGKRSSEIEVLAGPEGQQIDDANYFRDKLFTALKVPKSYLGMDETVGRANLSQLDVRFARSVMRVQREIKNGFTHIARVDLAAKNIDPDLVDFTCKMVVPSGVLELAQIEVQNTKLDLASKYQGAGFSEYYVWSEVLGLSDDNIAKIRTQRSNERGADPEAQEMIDRSINHDRERVDPKAKMLTQQIRDEMAKGQTELGRRMKNLHSLVQEMRYSLGSGLRSLKKH